MVSPKKYYLFLSRGFKDFASAGIIVQRKFLDGEYYVAALDGITHGNWYDGHLYRNHTSLKTLIHDLVQNGNKVLEFDTPKLLFQWAIENLS